MLFRLVFNVDSVSLYLPVSECLVFGRVVKTACGARVLAMARGLNDLGARGLGVGRYRLRS